MMILSYLLHWLQLQRLGNWARKRSARYLRARLRVERSLKQSFLDSLRDAERKLADKTLQIQRLERHADFLADQLEGANVEIEALRRSNAALKGVITKYKTGVYGENKCK